MQKRNRILMGIVSTLLCLTLLSSSLVSGIFAKFAFEKGVDSYVQFKKWGITLDAGSDVAAEYKKSDDTIMVHSNSGNVIAPGTNGCLAWFKVQSSGTEVKFKLDFEGTIDIGDGYSKAKKYVKDANGREVDYFPIIFLLVAYDVDSNGNITQVTTAKNVDNKTMNFTIGHRYENGHGVVGLDDTNRIYSFKTLANVASWINGVDDHGVSYKGGLSKVFDQKFETLTNGTVTGFTRIYTVQWCWPYNANNADASYPRKEYKVGTYQTKEYDTQIGEAMKNHPTDFDIKLDMRLTVEQLSNS